MLITALFTIAEIQKQAVSISREMATQNVVYPYRGLLFSHEKKETLPFAATWIDFAVLYLVTQSCPTLCDPMNHSLPGSSVCGIFQTRVLEWVAMPSSRGSSRLRDGTQVSHVSCIGRRVLYY